jgi:hypothetical protein
MNRVFVCQTSVALWLDEYNLGTVVAPISQDTRKTGIGEPVFQRRSALSNYLRDNDHYLTQQLERQCQVQSLLLWAGFGGYDIKPQSVEYLSCSQHFASDSQVILLSAELKPRLE